MNSYERVLEFHEAFGAYIGIATGKPPAPEREKLRIALIEEELQELKDAVEAGDYVEVADALGDLEYVINGMAIEYAIPLPEVVEEIHRSNMTKLGADGKPILRADGKILKSDGYEPPDLKRVLFGD